MFRSFRSTSLILPIISLSLFAGPKIEFNTRTYNCGIAYEGKTEKLNAVFIVKNTGNEVLKLANVKPGCGCTVVKYDSLVQPGKSVNIESQVNIKNYRGGKISKYITVYSNAVNDPTVRLTIEATLKAIIDISDSYLSLDASNLKSPHSIYLTSRKSDLKVSEILFNSNENSDVPQWQSSIHLNIKFNWTPVDSTIPDSSHVFKLDLFTPNFDKPAYGEFILKTNHPEKPEINLPGNINKLK